MKACFQKKLCPYCEKEINIPNFTKHLMTHENGRYKECQQVQHDGLNCIYCGKECKNKNSLAQHEVRCKKNPNRKGFDNFAEFNKISWNKGLTKETDNRVLKQSISVSKILKSRAGHKQTEETKNKISKSRKKYLFEHPDKVPYLINHSSKMSYPEKYFI